MMLSKQCNVCVKEEKDYVDTKVASQDMTDKEAAAHLKVSERDYAAHYETHVRRKLVTALSTDIVPLKEIVIDKINTVAESADRLRKVVLAMSENILLKTNEFDSKDILALGQMERNLVQTVKDLAMLTGDLTTGDTTNIQVNIEKAEMLTSIMMENACPRCKNVFLNKLKQE